jgi:hypothetical protein
VITTCRQEEGALKTGLSLTTRIEIGTITEPNANFARCQRLRGGRNDDRSRSVKAGEVIRIAWRPEQIVSLNVHATINYRARPGMLLARRR